MTPEQWAEIKLAYEQRNNEIRTSIALRAEVEQWQYKYGLKLKEAERLIHRVYELENGEV